VIALGVAIVVMRPATASTHERQVVGRYRLTIGWGEEPAFTGSRNFVSVAVSDTAGMPVADLSGSLAVEIAFGDQRLTLPLRPAWQRPAEFRAWLVPTRSGTYSFHITGTVKDQKIDATSTCSEKTFDCPADVSEIQFPVRDPSAGQLAERVSRALPRTERAIEAAAGARRLAIAALVAAVLALVAAIGLGIRGGRRVA
jgi:hypothetical protein